MMLRRDRHYQKRPNQAAFTLIELIVASVLTTLLSVAVLRVIQSTLRTSVSGSEPVCSRVIVALRHDLESATYFQNHSDRVVLFGPIARNSQLLPLGQNAMVEYVIERLNVNEEQSSILLRQQLIASGPRTNQSARPYRQPLCLGIGSVSLVTNQPQAGYGEAISISSPQRGAIFSPPNGPPNAGWQPLPSLRKLLLLDVQGSIIHAESILQK